MSWLLWHAYLTTEQLAQCLQTNFHCTFFWSSSYCNQTNMNQQKKDMGNLFQIMQMIILQNATVLHSTNTQQYQTVQISGSRKSLCCLNLLHGKSCGKHFLSSGPTAIPLRSDSIHTSEWHLLHPGWDEDYKWLNPNTFYPLHFMKRCIWFMKKNPCDKEMRSVSPNDL